MDIQHQNILRRIAKNLKCPKACGINLIEECFSFFESPNNMTLKGGFQRGTANSSDYKILFGTSLEDITSISKLESLSPFCLTSLSLKRLSNIKVYENHYKNLKIMAFQATEWVMAIQYMDIKILFEMNEDKQIGYSFYD